MKKFIQILISCLLIVSCNETDILDESGNLEISEFNLPNLPENHFYEAWLLVDGSYVSVGKITNDSLSQNSARFSNIDKADLTQSQSFAITIETNGSPAPSNYVLLVGDFVGNTAQLSSDSETSNGVMALAKQLSASYTVQNASVPAENQNEYGTNGIWFFKGSGSGQESTLEFDYNELKYQAWLTKTHNGLPYDLNLGVIENDTLTDNSKLFIPNPFVANIPDFPGEDFLQQPSGSNVPIYPENFFPVDVRNAKIKITPIFPSYNNIETAFPINLLEAVIPADATKDPNLTRELQINTNFGAKATKL